MAYKRIYIIFLLFIVAGYVWIYLNYTIPNVGIKCMFKSITNIPCPSCGTTRAILSIVSGDLSAGYRYNPLAYVYIVLMLIVPIWMIVDLIQKRITIIKAYNYIISKFSSKMVSLPFATIIVLNWIWNIFKML
jgi:hypothetical protein